MQLAFFMEDGGGGCLVITVWFQRVAQVFNLINNTGLNEVQPAPNWEDFIQNSLISCFINLEPQAEMFKAAGRPGPVVQEERANEWEERRQRDYVCTLANASSEPPDDHYQQSCWESHQTFRGEQSHACEAALTVFPGNHTEVAVL